MFFPLSKCKSGKKVLLSFIVYILINFVVRTLKELFADSLFSALFGTFALLVNIYIYIGIFLLAYNFIMNTKR